MKLRQLFEAEGKTAVVAFGRMNPPTIGHAKLVDKVKSLGGDPYIFLSQSQKPKTDPLAFADKLRYAKFFFPEVTIGNPEVRTPIQMMQYLEGLGYTDIIYVAGSDRAPAFDKLFNDYNGKDYNFNSIEIVSAGERDPDADGAEGMSASKMRAAAAEGNLDAFKQGVPRAEVADEMFAAVRQGMGIRDAVPAESIEESDVVLDRTHLREYIREMIREYLEKEEDIEKLAKVLKMLVGKEVKSRGSRYTVTDEDIAEACKSRKKKMRESEYTGPLSDKQKELLRKGYKLDKDGVPYWEPDGATVSPFYRDELGPGWDQDSLDRDADEIEPGASARLDRARTDPNSSYRANTTTNFSGGGSTTRHRDGRVERTPGINARISTTTSKNPGEKLRTKTRFRGNL